MSIISRKISNDDSKKTVFFGSWIKILLLAFAVGISSEIKLSAAASGFIIALSVLLMGLFLYYFEEINSLHFILCCAIVSPMIRFISEAYAGNGANVEESFIEIIPDVAFFVVYAVVYTFMYVRIFDEGKAIRNFPVVIFSSDAVGNIAELALRSFIFGSNAVTFYNIGLILGVAFIRTLIMQIIIIAVERYSNILIKHEMDEEFKQLLVRTAMMDGEMYIIDKNLTEMEAAMKQAYELYRKMEDEDNIPDSLKKDALAVARLIHEIKGDYKGVAEVLRTQFMYEADSGGMRISDIISIEKKDVEAAINTSKIDAEISIRLQEDFYVKPYFAMMSVIRNLIVNAVEAIAETPERRKGRIKITVTGDDKYYYINVYDNGRGISEKNLSSIFLDGFSTKFDEKTGKIQRGLGLSLVKHYVEDFFCGSMDVESSEGEYTRFVIRIPTDTVRGRERGDADEVLHS